jgi:hypothetical protein
MSPGGTYHEHIQSLKAIADGTGTLHEDTREAWHDWIVAGNSGYVRDEDGDVVGVRAVTNAHGTRWVQTYADETPKDNLLRLPRY